MTSLDDNILPQFNLEGTAVDHDILDEFLDQRVYDSITNSPEGLDLDFNNNHHGDILSHNQNGSHSLINTNYVHDHDAAGRSVDDSIAPDELTHNFDSLNYDNFDENLDNENKTFSNEMKFSSFSNPNEYSCLEDYEFVRNELTKLKFGNPYMNPCPETVDVVDPSYLDFSESTMNSLPYKLDLFNLPNYSRVETQIKLKFSLSPPPPHQLLHIPQDLISKNKFCLQDSISSLDPIILKNLLYLDAYVLTSNGKKSCNICSRCIRREQKRASRRKVENGDATTNFNSPVSNPQGSSSNGGAKPNLNSWADENMMKKALIFNCKEIVSFPSPSGLNDLAKSLELSARIICYCRHHKESSGFKLLFVVKDYEGRIVAKQLSSPIMIMDRKKTSSTNNNAGSTKSELSMPESAIGSLASSSTNLQKLETDVLHRPSVKREMEDDFTNFNSSLKFGSSNQIHETNDSNNISNDVSMQPISPNSIDESESQTNTDSNDNNGRSLKRKKLSIDDSLNTSTNPMFNGSTGFSPISNSDTNTSVTNPLTINPKSQAVSSPTNQQISNLPSIQRIIPAQGPIRGGIEVTLLGFNFTPGLAVKFGANQALATHCWSETTIVTYLPPATQPGQVLVSFENHENLVTGQQQIFTYTDDTDRQLIELALQIVGLKMNGKLEDARNIAKRIVGSDSANGTPKSPQNTPVPSNVNMNEQSEWLDNAQRAVEELTKSNLATEEILISFLRLVDLPNCPIIIPNWQLCNEQGQTLLHLATIKNYTNLIKFLITHGCKIDIQDNQGLTPLFFASMCGHRNLMDIFIDCKSNWNLKLSNDKYLRDYCDLNVMDIFNNLSELELDVSSEDFGDLIQLNKSGSLDSLNSMFAMNYGQHVSKMVAGAHTPAKTNTVGETSVVEDTFEEFADSEFESDDGYDVESVESEDGFIADDEDNEVISVTSNSTIIQSPKPSSSSNHENEETSIWQRVKNVFGNDEEDAELPSYNDLFPIGPSFGSKPKTSMERSLNDQANGKTQVAEVVDDGGVASDSSEDMVVSYINHPRKTVENDKMLLFFWFPVLIFIVGIFFMGSIGYKFETIESVKTFVRNAIGNVMVGNERIGRVFRNNAETLVDAI